MIIVLLILAVLIGLGMFLAKAENDKISAMPQGERDRYLEQRRLSLQAERERSQAAAVKKAFGDCNAEIVCPHCTKKGQVRVKQVKQKKGISGAKATGAILTAGVSILATGLSRKEKNTQAHCGNCESTWFF